MITTRYQHRKPFFIDYFICYHYTTSQIYYKKYFDIEFSKDKSNMKKSISTFKAFKKNDEKA